MLIRLGENTMPWCPVCRYEYKEGFKTCADCGAPLVANFEDIERIEEDPQNHDDILNMAEFAQTEALSNMDLENAFADIIEDKEGVFIKGENAPDVEEMVRHENNYKPFMKAKDRANEYKSSAFALLLVGVLGIIFLLLCVFNIIPLSIHLSFNNIGFIAMLVICVIFILVGIKSIVEAKMISELGDIEDELVDNIQELFANQDRNGIDAIALSEDDIALNDELKFFKREAVIRNMIIEKFGEIDKGLLDNQVELIFNKIFDEE